MGELQLGLLAIGAAVVAAVFLYNRWQERRYRREAEASFSSRHEDVLMRSLAGSEQGKSAPGSDRPGQASGAWDASSEASQPGLSEILDFIVTVETAKEIRAGAVLKLAAAALERCSKPIRWEGFDEAQGSWGPLNSERGYLRLRSGMQLVDRRGAADAEELAEFGAAIEQAAASIGALAPVPDPRAAIAKAGELDRFCGEVDFRVAVHIVSDATPFTGARLEGLAKTAGFELDRADGKFRRRDKYGRILCALLNFDPAPFSIDRLKSLSTHGVTLELDVPRTPRGAFEQFRDTARLLAERLSARIVDDNRQPLGPAAFDAIGARVQAVHTSMEARGIVPGGALALRLFS
jgi:hypothetical protein